MAFGNKKEHGCGGTESRANRSFATCNSQELKMHKDEAKGGGKQIKGALKDAAGGLTGNERLQAEGKADKVVGKVQQKAGELKDKARDALKH
jgi:uncharacterized protein YjbJ (UPF0337 family)